MHNPRSLVEPEKYSPNIFLKKNICSQKDCWSFRKYLLKVINIQSLWAALEKIYSKISRSSEISLKIYWSLKKCTRPIQGLKKFFENIKCLSWILKNKFKKSNGLDKIFWTFQGFLWTLKIILKNRKIAGRRENIG